MTWPATNVMMLGKLRASDRRINDPSFPPRPSIDYIPTNVTRMPGQNIMQQIVMNGVHGLRGGLGGIGLGLGDAATDAAPAPSVAAAYSAMPTWWKVGYPLLVTTSGALSLYHGYKRHGGSLGWGLGWFALGTLFPVVTPTVAFAQGFGKRKGR